MQDWLNNSLNVLDFPFPNRLLYRPVKLLFLLPKQE